MNTQNARLASYFGRLLAALLLLTCAACGGESNLASAPTRAHAPVVPLTRTWQMGFAFTPPRPTTTAVIQGIDRWSTRAELAAIHQELPWRDLLGGMSPDAILDRDMVQLINYMRGKGLKIFFMADTTDGLSRAEEAPQLRALGRSIMEPDVQAVYRSYVLAAARKLNPDFIGLAAETNLIRAAASPAVYAAVVRAANDAAADLRAAGNSATLLVSVQVETGWGVLGGNSPYSGIERDFTDFPFVQMLGLSSYPYLGYAQPEDIPANYYTRLLNGRTIPVMVVEGGWTSASVANVRSSEALQARYVARHDALLRSVNARGLIQLLFSDVDMTSLPQPVPVNLPLFVKIGLTDADLNAKPVLAEWDAMFAKRLQ